MAITIRAATAPDADSLFTIRAESRRQAYQPPLSAKSWRSFLIQNELNAGNLASWRTHVQSYLADVSYIFRVAEHDEIVAGWSLSEIRPDSVHLMRLFVDPQYQGQHIGSRLLEDLFASAGDKPITLTVLKTNAQTIAFYERHGFVQVGDAHYSFLGVPCLRMRRQP